MILLDTNVLSGLMRREPEAQVVAWLDAQPSQSIWTTSITLFEVEFGIELLPASRRREELQTAFALVLEEDLENRVVPFDRRASKEAGRLAAQRRQAGRPVEIRDVQIAGITLARNATLATRNQRHFEDLGVRLVNPWDG